MSHPLKLLLLGYYGFGNAGDELILDVIQRQIASIGYPFQLTVVASAKPLRLDPSTKIIFRREKLKLIKELARCDVFLLGGGGLIQDKTSFMSLLYYLGAAMLARLMGCEVVLWSIGVETLKHPFSRTFTRWVLRGKKIHIWARDEESKEILESIGLEGRVSLSADPCFLIDDLQETPRTKKLIVIPRAGGILSKLSWADFAGLCRQKLGLEPVVLAMHPQADAGAIEVVGRQITILSWDSLEGLKKHFREATCVVSERLHGVILSALSGTPFAGIGPVEKTGRFCAKTGAPWRAQIDGCADLIQIAKEALEPQNSRVLREKLDDLQRKARSPTQGLLRFFNM